MPLPVYVMLMPVAKVKKQRTSYIEDLNIIEQLTYKSQNKKYQSIRSFNFM